MSEATIVPTVTVKPQHIRLDIEGMSCASCVRHVTKALENLEGVSEARVNLATNRADVVFDGKLVDLTLMREALAKRGYQAKLTKQNNGAEKQARESAKIFRAFLLALLFTLPVFVLEMGGSIKREL